MDATTTGEEILFQSCCLGWPVQTAWADAGLTDLSACLGSFLKFSFLNLTLRKEDIAISSASECRQKYHLLRTARILYSFHGCQTVTNASCRVFNLQSTNYIWSWASETVFLSLWQLLLSALELCANGSSLHGTDLSIWNHSNFLWETIPGTAAELFACLGKQIPLLGLGLLVFIQHLKVCQLVVSWQMHWSR